jgi:hypothetical protein
MAEVVEHLPSKHETLKFKPQYWQKINKQVGEMIDNWVEYFYT